MTNDPTGFVTLSTGRTIGEGDFSLLTNLTWLTGEAHVNRLLAEGNKDSRVLPPIVVAAVGLGLGWTATMRGQLSSRFSRHAVRSTYMTLVTGVPVNPGDTLRVRSKVESGKSVADPNQELLTIVHEVQNEHEQIALTLTQELLVVIRDDLSPEVQ